MSTTPVTIHLSHRRVPAKLSTDRAESSYGRPVLVMNGGGSYPEDRPVAFGPGDVTDLGLAAALLLEVEPDADAESLLEVWYEAATSYLDRHGLHMAEEWLDAGGWTDGSTWTQEGEDGGARHLADELDRAPLDRAVVLHVAGDAEEDTGAEGASWTFPDGSGVVEVGDGWAVFNPEGETGAGRIVRSDS